MFCRILLLRTKTTKSKKVKNVGFTIIKVLYTYYFTDMKCRNSIFLNIKRKRNATRSPKTLNLCLNKKEEFLSGI